MTNLCKVCAPMLILCAATAQAADNKLMLNSERTNFTGLYGKSMETSLIANTDRGATAFTLGASYGKRDFGASSSSAVRLSGTVYRDFGERFFTRSSLAIATNKPVFATREVSHDFNFKPVRSTVLTLGGKYARYFDNRDALSWSAGASFYFKAGLASYRYSSFDVTKLGRSQGHLGSLRIKDTRGAGSTQLWVGTGTSVHDQLHLPTTRGGKYRSFTLQRTQPLNNSVGINLGVGQARYEVGSDRYSARSITFGLIFSEAPKLLHRR